MKAAYDCHQCLRRLARQAAELATSDALLRSQAIEEGLRIVAEDFSYDRVSITIAARIHRAVREITGNPDPYRGMKDEEMRVSRELLQGMTFSWDFRSCLELAALGNSMDFFRGFDTIESDVGGALRFARDDSHRFGEKLKRAAKVLYLADNAGEVFFDLPLVKWMRRSAEVIYVVKGSPVGDDITLEDMERVGLNGELERVITTGTATPGVDLSLASEEFKGELMSADLVLAKGMAYYEALSELPREERFFFCLRAKCKPVADSLGVPLDSYVAMLW